MSIRFRSLTCQSTPAVRSRQRSKNMRAVSVPQIPTPHFLIVELVTTSTEAVAWFDWIAVPGRTQVPFPCSEGERRDMLIVADVAIWISISLDANRGKWRWRSAA